MEESEVLQFLASMGGGENGDEGVPGEEEERAAEQEGKEEKEERGEGTAESVGSEPECGAGDVHREGERTGEEEREQGPAGEEREESAWEESLGLLGWGKVCRQVAFFCCTPQGFKRALAGGLPMGGTMTHSAALQAETR